MEYDILNSKMLKKDQLPPKPSEIVSTCSELNLNTDKLDIETLMLNPIYRRLFNIVKNDMSRSDLSFRKNLIKELYFLLQITPIIKPELMEHFLAEIEKWYNLNDHKKIDLASNKLNKLLNIVHHNKKETANQANVERPKTGVTWNQNVSPFLRPYTAQRSSKPTLKPGKAMKTESSKFGEKSTKVDTNDDICIRQFTTNIQEQLQISQDFLQKHRTNHPDYQPTYEQLYNILKKVETHSNVNDQQDSFQIPLSKAARYSKSALPRKKEVAVRVKEVNVQSYNHIADNAEEQVENQERERDSDSDSSEDEQEILYVNENKREAEPHHKVKAQTQVEQTDEDGDNLVKYAHCVENKLIQALREDREMARNYVNFARVKTAMKRELNRKNQSKRMLSAKQSNARQYKFTRTSTVEDKENTENVKVYDLSKDPLSVKQNIINPYPTYNKRQFLKKRYEQPTRLFKKLNNIEEPTEKVKSSLKRPMTAFVRFHSPVRFDPLSSDNVLKYNEDVLQEIQKIKMKMGSKCSASTDSLMKALYVDLSNDSPLRWQDQNPFYGMISKGKEKKLKKRGRKLKSKGKTLPVK